MLLLEANRLSKSFGGKTVLTDVCFDVDSRQIVSIMGPSGQGKSTVARILCGTVRPDRGRVSFGGRPLVSADSPYDESRRREIQLIPQQPFAALDPRQRVGDAICEPLLFHQLVKNKAEARQQAESLMEKVLLDPALYDRRPGELSGGQAQRVLIARSLTVSPKMLIADEATSMLDVSSQAQVIRIFCDLVENEGISLLLITHDHSLADSVSHRIYQLSDGIMQDFKNLGGRTHEEDHSHYFGAYNDIGTGRLHKQS